jgi:uncharacterized protein (TIGR02001 family)
VLIALATACLATPAAAAEFGASISLQSDARFRGYTLSRHRPTASLALSIDIPSGFYLSGSVSGVATAHSGVQFLGTEGNLGFAQRLASGVTLDVGIQHYSYSEYYTAGHSTRYEEFYIGLIGRNISAHIYYSPNYYDLHFATVYGELEGVAPIGDKWRINAHIGAIVRTDGEGKPGYDWRLGIARQLKPFELRLAVSGGGPMLQYYSERTHRREAVTAGISYIF